MVLQRTLSIIKPDATRRGITGNINAKIEAAGLRIIAQKMLRLTKEQAAAFYEVHAERSFYEDLCNNMTKGPIIVQVLEGDNAISVYRDVMGATNPINAAPGSIRREFGESIDMNSVHGSDAVETAAKEIEFFFNQLEIQGC
ncbi:MAG: nucleoside-diphosphate kinase [Holosporales bacterium]|jgi:nucleoside-diphosphate kinase|nr:nucleoside-diphosphate kinase [Holosporales bacterium]